MTDTNPENVDTRNLDDAIEDFSNDFERIDGVPEDVKKQWENDYGLVFRIWFLGQQYIYRNFTYFEYTDLANRIKEQYKDTPEQADEVFKTEIQKLCVLWPKDYATRMETGKPQPLPGGIPFVLGDYILAASGFTDGMIPDMITNKR